MTADFIQISSGSSIEGKLSMSRPGKVRFEYTDDIPMLIVSNGNNISFIDSDSIPSVTTWGIIGLIVLFLGIPLFYMRRRAAQV